MSRIDEAMRRAAGAGAEGPVRLDNERAAHTRNAGLEDYLAEPASVSACVTRPKREVITPAERLPAVRRAPAGPVVGSPQISPAAVEQYRRLAAVLHEAQVERGIKSLVVSSAVPREGKTLTITNLALTLSDAYHSRVLLIDADLRRPAVHDVLGIPNTRGLKEALQGDSTNVRLVDVSRFLSVLPAGQPTPNPVAELTGERMASFLRDAVKTFDWVLIDTPPVGILPDAQHLARLTDGVLMVIGAGSTHYDLVRRAIAEVGTDRIVGTILNKVQESAIPMTSYYDDYYGHARDVEERSGLNLSLSRS
jgi:capsular exopolysaccharide synthesis family protein